MHCSSPSFISPLAADSAVRDVCETALPVIGMSQRHDVCGQSGSGESGQPVSWEDDDEEDDEDFIDDDEDLDLGEDDDDDFFEDDDDEADDDEEPETE